MRQTIFFLVFLTMSSYAISKTKRVEKILTELITLNEAAGYEASTIGVIIAQVANSFRENQQMTEYVHSKISANCKIGQRSNEEFLNKLRNESLEFETHSHAAKEIIIRSEIDINKYQSMVEETQYNLGNLKNKVAKVVEDMSVYGAEAEQKLVVVRSLISLIRDELLTDNTSFVQLKTREFSAKVNQLKDIMRKMKAHESKYSPMVLTLVTLAESKGFSDSKILNNIVEVLTKLETNLKQFRANQDNNFKNTIADLKSQIVIVNDQLKTYNNLLAEAQGAIQSAQNTITSNDNIRNEFELTLKRKESEILYWDRLCENENQLRENDLLLTTTHINYVNELARKVTELN